MKGQTIRLTNKLKGGITMVTCDIDDHCMFGIEYEVMERWKLFFFHSTYDKCGIDLRSILV